MISSFKAILLLAAAVAAEDSEDEKELTATTYVADTAYLVYNNGSAAATSMQSIRLETDSKTQINLTTTLNMTRQYDWDKSMDKGVVWNCLDTPRQESGGATGTLNYEDYTCTFARGQNMKDGDGTVAISIMSGTSESS